VRIIHGCEVEKCDETYNGHPVYSVKLNGELIAEIERSEHRWSKKAGRLRVRDYYRNVFRVKGAGYHSRFDRLKDVIEDVLEKRAVKP
jgi:hypothetical protein